MDSNSGQLTVYFEDPFWVGVFERIENGKLSACKVTFGEELKDYEVWEFVLKHYDRLKFSPSVDVVVRKDAANPKQMQREEHKLERKAASREQREAEKQRQFERKQQKRKEKHRGR